MVGRRRHHQWCGAPRAGKVRIGATVEQHENGLGAGDHRGVSEQRHLRRHHWQVQVGVAADAKEPCDEVVVDVVHAPQGGRNLAEMRRRQTCARQQVPHVVAGCRKDRLQQRVPRRPGIDFVLEEQAHDVAGAALGGSNQRGRAVLRNGIDVRAAREQQGDLGGVGGGPHQGGGAVGRRGIDVGAGVEEHAHRVERTHGGGVHQRSRASGVGRVRVGPRGRTVLIGPGSDARTVRSTSVSADLTVATEANPSAEAIRVSV